MQKSIRLVIVLVAAAGSALAVPVAAPELDGGSLASGLGLLFGAALMIRTKR
jgi:hypothetical protein